MVHIKIEGKRNKKGRHMLCGKLKQKHTAVYVSVYNKFPELFDYCKNCKKCLTKGDT